MSKQRETPGASALSRFPERLYGLYFSPVPCNRRFLMRMGFGAILVFYYARLSPHVLTFFGPAGVGGADTLRRWPAFPGLGGDLFERFRVLHLIGSSATVLSLYALLLLASACFCVGFRTRTAGTVAILLHVVFSAHQPHLTWGWALMFHVFALYVVLSDPGAAYSVDRWLLERRAQQAGERAGAAGSAPDATILESPWAFRLLQLHVVCMYLVSGWPRLTHAGWLRGETVFHAVADVRYGRFLLDWYSLEPLLRVGAYYALVLEPLATILLLVPATRRWCALGLVAMHLGIELTADVGMWQFTMVTALIAFLPESWVTAALGRLPSRVRATAPRATAPIPTAEAPHSASRSAD